MIRHTSKFKMPRRIQTGSSEKYTGTTSPDHRAAFDRRADHRAPAASPADSSTSTTSLPTTSAYGRYGYRSSDEDGIPPSVPPFRRG